MKKIILFVSLCFPLLFSCCEGHVDRMFTSEYIFKNATAVPINFRVGYIYYSDDEYEKFQILSGEEVRQEYISYGGYIPPFYTNSLLIVDNGSKQVASQKTQSKDDPLLIEGTGLFCVESYELISDTDYYGRRTYRFVFTDDYFKNGEPMENFPTE